MVGWRLVGWGWSGDHHFGLQLCDDPQDRVWTVLLEQKIGEGGWCSRLGSGWMLLLFDSFIVAQDCGDEELVVWDFVKVEHSLTLERLDGGVLE